MSAAEKLSISALSPDMAPDCVAFVSDNQTHGVVANVAQQFFATPAVLDGGTKEALEYLSEAPAPRVIIVDLGESSAPLAAMLSLSTAFSEDTRLIGIGTVNDIELYRELVGAGVTDYLVKPVTEKALMTALSRTEEKPVPAAETKQKERRRIAVVGSRGGVGATTVAVNLAWIFAEDLRMKTALLDLDLEFGTIALALDLEPTRGLREALENPGRIDSLFISSALSKLTDRLSVMAAEETLGGEVAFNPGAVDVMFEALSHDNDCLLVDVPRAAVSVRQRVFQAATRIVLVTELSLPGLRDSIRLLGAIEQVAQDKPISIVANRVGTAQQAMQMADFKKALGRKVDLTIPDDHKALIAAVNAGKPLVQAVKASKSAKALRALASKLAATKIDEKPEGGLLRFLKKK